MEAPSGGDLRVRGRRSALLLALALDMLGEPPASVHPVVWMGTFLKGARGRWRARTPLGQLTEGGAWWALGAGLTAGAGWLAERLAGAWVTRGVLLKPLLARRALFGAVGEVHAALAAGHLPEARRLLTWHLVSRETGELSEAEVAGACVESLAENLSDSVVAPLLMFRAGGLPLAALYRYANTADAIWGYRTPDLEHAGKPAARADDFLNLAPARLTALCAVLAALPAGLDLPGAWRGWRRDAPATPSPNAGHPMSAFAGALGVRLDKRGVYVLNSGGRDPEAADVPRALRLAHWTLALAVLSLLLPAPRRGRR
ncbi:cobalamin biosynthesis protein CobD [Deinococcus aetherius]|uniref:Cobalamin biosynthesis protein CobD n=1 Tax=Deinococcus aetherius TaxID=200252 RepID=A0ABN6RBP7_9DEIO|nr:CobD/CbiB family cobalamin biosynthesis protein [Deinococcus aetherius]BDP40083.1 cobalamin biosynthesis protein CobD [Deinococcus aetherius]